MTKNSSNSDFTSSSNSNKNKDVKVESVNNNVDKLMDLNMEEFQKVLDQVIDHSLPESEKSPLVQKLNLEHAKEDNCLEDVIKQNKSKFKNLNKKTNKLNNLINDKLDTSYQSSGGGGGRESHLQKLESYCETFVNNNCQSATSFTNSILSNCNQLNSNLANWDYTRHKASNLNGQLENSNLTNRNSFKTSLESSQKFNYYDNSKRCCDSLNCDCIKRQKSKLLYNVSNTTEDFEYKDYSRRAQLVEYSPSLKYADLKENADYDDHKLEPLIKTKDLKTTKLNYFDQANQLKYNLVNTQFAEKVLGDELKDNSNRNYSSDCLNRYQTSLIDNQSHKLSSSTSDGFISSMNAYFENDNKSSNFNLNSNYLKKGSTSSIQTNGKSENNHLKKKKKPEKKLTQDCQGYVGYLDVNFLTNYITGNKSDTNTIRNQVNNQTNTKDMNVKKKDKKEFNGNGLNGNKQNKKSGNATTTTKETNENDKNNNLAINASNIIPNSSNHQSPTNTIRKNSTDLNENNQNMNNQANKQNNKLDKKNDRNKSPSNAASSTQQSNANRKSSATNLESKNKNTNSMSSIVSNSLNGGIDSLYMVSDSELPDQEGDFKIVNFKNLRRKKQKKNSNANQEDIKLNSNSQVHNGKINQTELMKQNKKVNQKRSPVHQNPATARGYESESDYCGVQERKKELSLKRELLIDQDKKDNSISNTDSESSNSLTATEEHSTNQTTLINESSANQLKTANVQQPFTNQNLILTNPNIPKTKISTNSNKISYAQVIKMNHTSNLNANGVSQTSTHKNEPINLVTNGNHNNLTQSTNSTAAKREAFKNSKQNSIDKSNKSNKSINSPEQIKKTDDKKYDKEQSKLNKKLNNNKLTNVDMESNRETKDFEQKESRISTANLSNLSIEDSSRTVTADSNDMPNFSSTFKSSSFSFTPPVIMLDKNTDQDTQFVFGFFDDENAQFQTNFEESNEPDEFRTINVNSVNFISNSREPVNANSVNSSLNNTSGSSFVASSNNRTSSDSHEQEVTSTRTNASSNVQRSSSGSDVATSTVTSSNGTLNRNASGNMNCNLNEINDDLVSSTTDTPICAGTYIMNCETDNTLSMRDSLTKHVNSNFNHLSRSSTDTLANEITSFNLTKFIKEKIPSPIDQQNFRNHKPNKPEFTCNVAYIQAVNYIRRAWEEVIHNKPTYLQYNSKLNSNSLNKAYNLSEKKIQSCN